MVSHPRILALLKAPIPASLRKLGPIRLCPLVFTSLRPAVAPRLTVRADSSVFSVKPFPPLFRGAFGRSRFLSICLSRYSKILPSDALLVSYCKVLRSPPPPFLAPPLTWLPAASRSRSIPDGERVRFSSWVPLSLSRNLDLLTSCGELLRVPSFPLRSGGVCTPLWILFCYSRRQSILILCC